MVDAALSGVPQEVSRRGKPAVVVLASEEYRRLLVGAQASRETFAAHLMAFPGKDMPRARVAPREVEF